MRHGQLVPAPVRPEPVHGVEHVEHGEVAIQGQAIPGGRADFGIGNVGLCRVDVVDGSIQTHEGPHQTVHPPLPAQVIQQDQERALAIVQGDVIEIIEHQRLGEFAQLRVDVAATECNDDRRMARLDRLGDAKRRVDIAREGDRHQNQRRAMPRHRVQGQVVQRLIDQVEGGREGRGQRIEGRLALRQGFRVAHEFEARIHPLAQHVGDIVQIQGGEVAGAILHPQAAESPGQGVIAIRVDVDIEGVEARSFGQKLPSGDTIGQAGVTPLQESDNRNNAGEIAFECFQEGSKQRRAPRQRLDAGAHRLQPLRRKQAQHQPQGEIFLHRVQSARTQETGQVRRRWIRGVELRHRRDDRQDAHRLNAIHPGFRPIHRFPPWES